METPADPRPGDEEFDGFRMQLPEDCVEYMLFVIGEKTDNNLPSLEAVRKAADKKLDELAKDYIWQRDPFKLETRTQKGLGLPYLYGTTHYGDNVEDEWLIVYLLRELSKSFPSLWIRVSDSDGEFLLIEAAKVTPKWLSPENDANRVWIHDGKLLIIPLSIPTNSSTTTTTTTGSTISSSPSSNSKPLTLREAIDTLRTVPPTALVHSPLIDAEAFYRLEKYPAQIAASVHHSLVTIPRKLAYVLHARPAAVAPATEAFYLRDPHALKPLLRSSSSAADNSLTFPPTDLVTVSVRFTKVLYAQLKSQRFAPPPPAWRQLLHAAEVEAASASAASVSASAGPGPREGREREEEAKKKLARLDMGMKLTTGFEILCQTPPEQSASRVVREVGLLLGDLAEDGGDSALPTDDEIARWEGVQREDDDGWMDIDFRDFERELDGEKGKAKMGDGEGGGFGDANAQADLQKIVSRFEAFLNDESAGIEGAEIDEMDLDNDDDDSDKEGYEDGTDEDEDKEVSFDEERYSRMMREMMGLPAEDVGQASWNAKVSAEEPDEQGENDDEAIRKMMEQMESELKGLGALDLDPKPRKATTTIKERGEGKPDPAPSEQNEEEEEEEEEESDKEVDIDYNLAKNLLESFKSQAGMAGPAGNLLGLMGMTLPRDEEGPDDSE
ncbi:SGT1 protein-domain-containing protein [Corynascus novoguineensis]|uniref:SGT1 protein-domain-containing protein n=1 Tax=Corynascus novoguineensis TaxID=1126955 RepID=A0AAN7CR58_9PEZI|nr:SGT1 protein-domain-containing protein [Corynascus novoguineensis]